MRAGFVFIFTFLIVVLACNAKEPVAVDATTVNSLLAHYFGNSVKINLKQQPNYVTGDFNADGKTDIAVLFNPVSGIKQNSQITVTTPWQIAANPKPNKYTTSLAIINGNRENWTSPKTRVFSLLDTSGALETPSFQLILMNSSNKDYKQHQSMLPVKSKADIIILPTEAGIDTYILGKWKISSVYTWGVTLIEKSWLK